MTIQKLFCKIMLRSFVLILGLISVTELSANPEFVYSASSLESSVTAPQGGGNVKMTGRVLDETKAGVPGATVIVKGSTRGVITGNDGTFSIDVKPTDVIEISYLGYETQSIPVGTKTNIVTELVRKVSELEAVTVVAYGKQRKESIIGAINTIDAGELEVASGSLSSNLAGKLAGIVVMQRTGEPGSSAEFWIRGQSTFGAKTTPLVLVDGIERDMDFVDADDIATFSILKDATATALYGVRGANGIILITTNQEEFLPTVLSRCVQLKLKPLKDFTVKSYLTEHLDIPEKEAEICAAFARGNLGKAIHLASSDEFKELFQKVMNIVKNVRSMDIAVLLDCIREIKEMSFDIEEVLDLMQLWYRDVLMFKVTKDMNLLIFKDEYKMINELGEKADYAGLEQILSAIDTARARLEANVNLELVMELLFLTMKNPA